MRIFRFAPIFFIFIFAALIIAEPKDSVPNYENESQIVKEQVALAPIQDKTQLLKIDHLPIAVHDLSDSESLYKRLGFSIKPGSVHKNSIENRHIKFADSSALELITVERPLDELSAYYFNFLRAGEGGAFISFDGGNAENLNNMFKYNGFESVFTENNYSKTASFNLRSELGNIFFIEYTKRPKEKGEYLIHSNTAYGIHAVWMIYGDFEIQQELLQVFNIREKQERVSLPPIKSELIDIELTRGHLYLLEDQFSRRSESRIMGVSVKVHNVESAKKHIKNNFEINLPIHQTQYGKSIYLPSSLTPGIRIEFIEIG